MTLFFIMGWGSHTSVLNIGVGLKIVMVFVVIMMIVIVSRFLGDDTLGTDLWLNILNHRPRQ